jgi:hypothetical protein
MPRSRKLALALLLALGGLGVYWFTRLEDRPREVTGVVRNQDGPVAGARVRIPGTAVTAVTDGEGRFRLTSPPADTGRLTAWKEGHFIAGSPFGTSPLDLRLVALPEADHEDYRWVDPSPDPARSGNCANCHAEIHREWSASAHSRSATGLHFRNLYEGTDRDGKPGVGWGLLTQHPDGSGVCASCHAPAIPENDPAAQLDLRRLSGVARQGVHCDYCHKIADVGDGTIGLTHGRFNLRLLRPKQVGVQKPPTRPQDPSTPNPEIRTPQLFFGPFDDVDRGEDAYSPLYRESRYCASCHEGVVFGVHVYSTYSEWLDSPARRQGKECQDCHMTPTGTMTNFAPGRGGIERDPQTLANHRFFAPSRDEMLRRSVRVEGEARRGEGGVRLAVRVRAEEVGHRVPTGFIDRHLILAVEALDSAGRPVAPRSGSLLPSAAGPDLEARPGRLFAKIVTGRDGKAPAPFWLAGGEPEDTRLVPGRLEEGVWQFSADTARVRVRLLYRGFWAETVREKKWPAQDTVVHNLTFPPD